MAILSNLLVNGTSRLLGKLYCSDLDVDSSFSANSLSVNGDATISGSLVLTKNTTIAATSYKNPPLTVGGTSSQKHLEFAYDNIQAKNGASSAAPLFLNYYGGRVYLSNTNKIYAEDGTLTVPTGNITTIKSSSGTFDNLNVVNTLRSNRWDLQSISQTGGSLYVSPTVKFPNSGTTLTVTKSSTALTLVITDSSITTADLAGITWTANSRVKVSGTINGVVTGTMDGTITSINTSSHALTLSVSGENWNNVVAGTYSANQFSDLNVMVYQRKAGSYDYRVGIWLNCYDMDNNSATIRIYGGTSSDPNVMIGNLNDTNLQDVNGLEPQGWGLFAQNAYLHGHIVANAGKIGGFTLGTESMYSGDNFPNTNNFYLMPTGSQSSTYNIAGSGALSNWVMTSGTTFGVTKDGKIYATAGKIGGFTLSAAYMYGNKTAPAANNLFLMPAGTSSSYTVAGVATTGWTITSGTTFGVTKAGAMYSTSGKIGGWNITASSLFNGTSAMNSTTAGLYLGTDGIRNYNSSSKYVNIQNGVITAVGANISGVLSAGANSTIGPWTITDSSIYKTNATWGNATAGAAYFGNNGISITNKFTVSASGELHAEKGDIAGFTITGKAIYKGAESIDSTTPGVYLGTDGFYCYNVDSGVSTYVKINNGKMYASHIDGYRVWLTGISNQKLYLQPNQISTQTNGNSKMHLNISYNSLNDAWDISTDGTIKSGKNLYVGSSSENTERQIACTSTGGTIYMFAQEGTRDNNSPNVGLWTSSGLLILKNLNTGYLSIDSKLTSSQDIRQLGWDGAVRRCTNSADGDGGRVAYVASGSSNAFSAYGQFGTTGSTYVTRKVTMTTSDVRLKENIYNTQEKGLDLLNNVRLVSFDWKDTHEHKSIGIIADELEKLNPELVAGGGYDEDGNMDVKAIDTLQLLSYTIKAIQEQQAEIESLKKQLASM